MDKAMVYILMTKYYAMYILHLNIQPVRFHYMNTYIK